MSEDHGAVMDVRAASLRRGQQPIGKGVSVDLRGLRRRRENRGRVGQGAALGQLAPAPPIHVKACFAARGKFASQRGDVRTVVRDLQAAFRLKAAGDAKPFNQSPDLPHGGEAIAIGPLRALRTDPPRELVQRSVDLVLEERRAAGGAPMSGLAPVKHDHSNSGFRQVPGHDGPRDARSDHRNFAGNVTLERRKAGGQTVLDRPEGAARKQIHSPCRQSGGRKEPGF